MESLIFGFIEFEKNQPKTMRGDALMYDVKGFHKYLTISELFDYYINSLK